MCGQNEEIPKNVHLLGKKGLKNTHRYLKLLEK